MKGDLESIQRNGPLLPIVIVIIVLSFSALAWEWRRAHTPAPQCKPHHRDSQEQPASTAGDSLPPSKTQRSLTTNSL